MKRIILIFAFAALNCAADRLLDPVNELGYGTVTLQAQALSMYRDYEDLGNGYSTTLGWKLDLLSQEWEGLSAGLSLIHVDVLHAAGGRYGSDGEALLSNGNVNELNEAWLRYTLGTLGLSNTFVKVGRQVLNGEVFRADAFRQKPRAFEAAIFVTKDIPDTVLTVGHVERISNVWDNETAWKFKEIEEVLLPGSGRNPTRGVTWIEGAYTGITNLEIAAYDAYAHDIANIAGGRAQYALSDDTSIQGYYRHETDVGKGTPHSSDMIGWSVQQKMGNVTLEPGFLSVDGDTLLFSEAGTGIHHPLGSSMMIYAQPFDGGADTAYLKTVTKINQTTLYVLYNYTWSPTLPYDGQELNVVVKQPIGDQLTVALKIGLGYHDVENGEDSTATDTRLFVTYHF